MPSHTFLTPLLPAYQFYPVNAAVGAGVALLTYVLLHALVAWVRRRVCAPSGGPDSTTRDILQKTLASTSSLAIALTALCVGLAVLELPHPWDERVKHLWVIGLGIQAGIYLHRALAIGASHYFRSRAPGTGQQLTVAHSLVVWGLQTVLWVTVALGMLANAGVNISTFIASLGIGGIAIALAVQNILGDLFASLSIAIDKPFEVGDAISVAAFTGTVEHVGLKTTRIRADSGEQIVIANAELLKSTVRNFKRMSRRRVQFSLRVNPDTPPSQAAKVPALLRQIIEAQPRVQFERAHLKSVDQSALEFDTVYYINDPAYGLFMDTQQAVLLAAMQALADLEVSVSLPMQRMELEQIGEARTGGGRTRPYLYRPPQPQG